MAGSKLTLVYCSYQKDPKTAGMEIKRILIICDLIDIIYFI